MEENPTPSVCEQLPAGDPSEEVLLYELVISHGRRKKEPFGHGTAYTNYYEGKDIVPGEGEGNEDERGDVERQVDGQRVFVTDGYMTGNEA